MNKAELVSAIAYKTKMSKSQIETYLDVTLNIIQKTVSHGEEVKIVLVLSAKPSAKLKQVATPKQDKPLKFQTRMFLGLNLEKILKI
jgi:hypothetical protein